MGNDGAPRALSRRYPRTIAGSRPGDVTMVTLIDIERIARSLAEARVPGSTRPGGHYHLSEAWRSRLQWQARAELERQSPVLSVNGTTEAALAA